MSYFRAFAVTGGLLAFVWARDNVNGVRRRELNERIRQRRNAQKLTGDKTSSN